jgi:hypothetical protein
MKTKITYKGENQELFQKTIKSQALDSGVLLESINGDEAVVCFDKINDRQIYNDFVLAEHEVGIYSIYDEI